MKLAKKLSEWEQIKLIDEKQKSAILAYESRQGKNRLPFILSALAVFCIGLGILSLIASNWQEIPDSLKLSADILLLGLTAVGAYRFYNRGKWYFEALVIGYATLILASIGLVGQVFQLQPVGLRAYLLWSVLVLPTALFSKKAVLPLVWIPVFVISGLDTLFDFAWFDKAIDFLESGLPYAGILTRLILLAFLSAGHLSESRLPVWKKSWKFWLVVSTALVTVVMDFGGMYYYGFGSSRTFPLLYEGIAAAIVILLLLLLFVRNVQTRTPPTMAAILATMIFYAFVSRFVSGHLNHDILGFALTMSILAEIIYFGFKQDCPKIVNAAGALAALRIFGVYLQVFGSLLTTGLGLISSGLVLLLTVGIWNKLKLKTEKCHE